MTKKIISESKFLLKLLWDIIKTPVILILVLLGRRNFIEVFRPVKDICEFVYEAKFTFWMIIILIASFLGSYFLPIELVESMINYPQDILSLRAYSLITSGFLHGNITHLIGNIIALFIFGRVVEQKIGAYKTALFYFGALLISNVCSSLIHIIYTKDMIGSVGASGAIMGLVSAAVLLCPFYLTYEFIIPIPIMVVGWFYTYSDITGIISQANDNIGHFAHLFGFLSISLLMYLMHQEERQKLKKGFLINLISLIIGVVIYFIILN